MTTALRFPTANPQAQALWAEPHTLLGRPVLAYLLIAAVCILIALRLLRTVVVPLGQLIQAVAAVAAVALAMGAAFLFLLAAAVGGL